LVDEVKHILRYKNNNKTDEQMSPTLKSLIFEVNEMNLHGWTKKGKYFEF